MKLFVRQPFTESTEAQRGLIQSVMDLVAEITQAEGITVLTDLEAQTAESFRARYEALTGQPFTTAGFRQWRLSLLNQADAMLIIRTGLSESSAFEVAYNLYGGRRVPMLFCIWEGAPLKTTLLSDLGDLCPTIYCLFKEPESLRNYILNFLMKQDTFTKIS